MGATLALATGLMFLALVAWSGTPSAYGAFALVGIVCVAVGSALQLGAIVDEIARTHRHAIRLVLRAAVWVAIAAGTTWLVGRAPGNEVLVGLIALPAAVGLVGVVTLRRRPWQAFPFLLVAGLLALVLGPIWVARS